MKIQIPENIDLNCSEQYILAIEVHSDQISFFLYNPVKNSDYFHYSISGDKKPDVFSYFQNIFFDNDFFTLPFKKIYIINYTQVFTFIPTLLYEEKDKEEYLKFLFTENAGRILHQTVQKPEMVIVYGMSENKYNFFQRSFADARIIHYTVPLITYFQEKGQLINGNRMIINKRKEGIDIFCFSRDNFLLGNHFTCSQLSDAVYYALFVWRQLKFNQLKDFIYILEEKGDLKNRLKDYVCNIVSIERQEAVPFEITALSLCEL
ncbi:MAG: DUF3822 family protein [Dysgonamonadaceae bacterium]|nr:DUF3822 family protein [Dysgonamonadaceae bacterium]